MPKISSELPQKIITYAFCLMFLVVPLILTPFNYELFEYNKMMLTYAFTVIIMGSWIIKMVLRREIEIARTPLDLPIFLYLLSQIISTFFSMDRHVSIFGYYSRFNGGLLSTFSYVCLYYAFTANFPKNKMMTLFKMILTGGVLVSIYGILEHFGIDKNLWVQDVQNRVFSTLGQPNWLAAYLAVLIPISIGFLLNSKFEYRNSKQAQNTNDRNSSRQTRTISHYSSNDEQSEESRSFRHLNLFRASDFVLLILVAVFYATLIFTKSRSGFLGFWIVNLALWLILFLKFRKAIFKLFLILNSLFLILNFIFGAPFPQINRFTLPELMNRQQIARDIEQTAKPTGDSIIDVGITESGKIREIVWKGAVDIFKHYPFFGSGVETFAFSYYKYRPAEHNMTSEWDFLYNKAHNEYLNYAATTGSFGLGSYLLIIIVFIGWNLKRLKVKSSKLKATVQSENLLTFNFDFTLYALRFTLFTAWLSILITNFFGFSVVIIQLFFFLIPAISFVFGENIKMQYLYKSNYTTMKQFNNLAMGNYQFVIIIILLSVISYLLFVIAKIWYADTLFTVGYHSNRASDYTSSYQMFKKAINLNTSEPLYYDEFSIPAAFLSLAFDEEKESSLSSRLREEAILASNFAISVSPNNVNFLKTRTRVYYALSQIDEKYLSDALLSLEQAKILSPTDPKIRYNIGLLQERLGKNQEAINELLDAVILKPDYRDSYYALAFLYDKNKEKDKAKEALNFILKRINPDDHEAKKKLEELK